MEQQFYYYVGLIIVAFYALSVVYKIYLYISDTRRLLAMMEVMDLQPKGINREKYFVVFVVLALIGLPLLSWLLLLKERLIFYKHVPDKHMYEQALRLAGVETK